MYKSLTKNKKQGTNNIIEVQHTLIWMNLKKKKKKKTGQNVFHPLQSNL